MSPHKPALESSEQRAADLESDAQNYESAADQAARSGHQRRARQLLQSAWASRQLAAEVRHQTPALIASAGRGLAQSAAREARRVRQQTAEQERVVRRWLRQLGPRQAPIQAAPEALTGDSGAFRLLGPTRSR